MIHRLSDVQSLNIGQDTQIWQFSVVLDGAVIGNNCNINCNVFIENDVIIGNNVTIKSGVQLWDGLRIEDFVFIGPNVTFTNDHIPRSKRKPLKFAKTIVKKNASVGANSTVLAGIQIGEYSLIGAGSVLTKDVPKYQVWYGNPAIHRGFVTEEGILLDLNLTDSKTGEKYIIINGMPKLK